MKKLSIFIFLLFNSVSSYADTSAKKLETMLSNYDDKKNWDLVGFYNKFPTKLDVLVKDFASIDDSKIVVLASVLDQSMGLDQGSSYLGFDENKAIKARPGLIMQLKKVLPKGSTKTNSLISFFEMYLINRDAEKYSNYSDKSEANQALYFYREYGKSFLNEARRGLGISAFDGNYCSQIKIKGCLVKN